jgi:hypothetical protein
MTKVFTFYISLIFHKNTQFFEGSILLDTVGKVSFGCRFDNTCCMLYSSMLRLGKCLLSRCIFDNLFLLIDLLYFLVSFGHELR